MAGIVPSADVSPDAQIGDGSSVWHLAQVREKAVLMVQSDPATRAKGPEHIAAYHWMTDYAAGVIAERLSLIHI